ncbi:hypothetical protein Q0F98_28385 [Paenibacillus amylolyticus]|uniref:hypothetical protein n=1 Tax=Paenibacillus sp. Y5S-9 TaxID=3122489 RepID=UPI0030CEA361|nr:hypothetical protein Q0F98_28385 [Paenibacillus amylolyticus]
MATVGDQLLNPESGWQRVDDANKSIKYNGNWLSVTGDPNTYAGTAHYFTLSGATTNSIEFYFYGTKLRIIDMYWSNRVNNVTVELDGVISSYNPNNSTNKYRVIVFERLNLQYGFHKVKLTTTSTSNNFSLDAIDIDSNGEIVSGLNKFLISFEDKHYSVTNKYKDNAIPAMTSNTSPNGIADASSFYTTFYPWKAFDRIVDQNGWVTASGVLVGWLSYEFPSTVTITGYSIKSGTTPANRLPKNWTFEGWDGVKWIVLDSRVNQPNFAAEEFRFYGFKNKIAYKKYRINVTANQGAGDFLSIGDLGMYELDKYISSVDNSETSFLEHGMNKGMIIDLEDEFSERRSLVKDSEKIGLGKVFKQKIDTSKTPIKRASIT